MRRTFNSSIHEEKREEKNKKKMYVHATRVGDASCRWKNSVVGGRKENAPQGLQIPPSPISTGLTTWRSLPSTFPLTIKVTFCEQRANQMGAEMKWWVCTVHTKQGFEGRKRTEVKKTKEPSERVARESVGYDVATTSGAASTISSSCLSTCSPLTGLSIGLFSGGIARALCVSASPTQDRNR